MRFRALGFMAFHSVASTSSVFNYRSRPRPRRTRANYRSISCRIHGEGPAGDDSDDANDIKKSNICPFFNLLSVPVTLTVISAALPQLASAAPAKVSERKRGAKKAAEALTPEQLKSWSEGLPVVTDRIPYTDLVELKKEGRLKHVIKPGGGGLRMRVEPVLVVLDDSRVARTVLPSLEGNRKFWEKWDELEIESLCVNAFSPPLKKQNLPKPYLGIQFKIPGFVQKWFEPKKLSKRALELKRMREEMKMRRVVDMELREEREIMEKAMKVQKKEEATRRRREIQKRKYEESLVEATRRYVAMARFWRDLAKNESFTTFLGIVFFALFYKTVVLSYKKQQKDYEDRIKIERAETDERIQKTEVEKMMQSGAFEKGDELAEEAGGEQNPYMKMAKQFMKSGARVRRAGVRKLPQYLETDVDVKFTDVAGLGKIRLELEEIVKFFTHGDMYRRRGIKIPGGILLCGPPGVGKTLLAKAVAGEAGVNFFSISASQFVEIYVGVGASRVRALYQEARESAPSVVFIDEIDAVGRKRGLIKGSGGQERDATLNQLLVCLDGFEGKGEVITMASTNRPDILDDALVRPGRFDRKIFIPKPGFIGRVEILKLHARNKPMAYDVDYMAVAGSTDGMVGAELANIIEVAAINMMRDGRTEITTDDLLQAVQMEEKGILEKKERSPEVWKQVAVYEAAMAVAALNFPDLKSVEYITIAPRAGRALGYVRTKMDYLKFQQEMLSRQSVLDHITVLLAPRAADELCFGKTQLSTIWAGAADDARREARMLIFRGLSDKHYGLNNFWVSDRINEIDTEALRILNICYDRAKEILKDNRKLLDALVEELVEKKSLTKSEIAQLVERYGCIRPMPPTIFDIRAAKLAEFKEKMITMKESQEKEVVDV